MMIFDEQLHHAIFGFELIESRVAMKQYVGIIRGINVGGHNKVNMKQLREAMETTSYRDVRTYIQSGNVVFRSAARSVQSVEESLARLLLKSFGVKVPVLVRDEKEWERTVLRNPFVGATDDQTKLLVTFLATKPTSAEVKALTAVTFPHDEFVIDGKDIFLFCKNGYGRCDIPNTFFEKKLNVTGTTRNWRTVLELQKMLTE